MATQVLFGCPRLVSGVTVNPMWIGDVEWLVADFGDTIQLIQNDPIFDFYGQELPVENKCLVIHLSASIVSSMRGSCL